MSQFNMWNSEIYNRFGKERIQPSIDLVNRIRGKRFNRILDVGCGTGMSTAPLVSEWKDAEIIGLDLSDNMLKAAKELLPSVKFIQKDCSQPLLNMGMFDLIFSNAFIQWLHNQEDFISNSFLMLNKEGIFASQIPLFEEMPAYNCILEAAKIFSDKFKNIEKDNFVLHSASEYYDIISKFTDNVEIWITDYCHQMDRHKNILEFLSGTALIPYMKRLDEDEQKLFLNNILDNLESSYRCQANGKLLFPFKRFFVVAQK